jgi:RhtB (resistance to homoserine/threonine) family protein
MKFSIILLSVAIIWTIAVITPGPNFFVTVKTAIGQSRRSALFSALGTSTGTILWGLSGFFGIALLFKTAPWIYLLLKLLGGGYLIYLGLKLIISNAETEINHSGSFSTNTDLIHSYRTGLLTNLSNPKTAAFVTSLFAATMPSNAPLELGLMSVALMSLISILWYASVAYVFSLDRFRNLYSRSRIWIDRIAGAIFIGFGIQLVDSD